MLVAAALVGGCFDDAPAEDCGACDASAPSDAGADGSTEPPPIDADVPAAPSPTCPSGNSGPGVAPNGSVPGAVTFPSPTIRNASIEWALTGDANNDGVVSVRFRRAGDAVWRAGMPLRLVPAGSAAGVSWPSRHSGSLFDLEPATTYEVELFLLDPDGGCVTQAGTFTTRTVPAPWANAPVKQVTPSNLTSMLGAAQPGDILELGAGTYASFTVTRDGQADKPIVLRGKPGAIISGDVHLTGRSHVHVTGLTINGRVKINSAVGIAFTRNTINAQLPTGDGIVAFARAENTYIADNIINGTTQWADANMGSSGNNLGEGILVTGPGHVVEHNRVTGFRDCISFYEETGNLRDQYSIDVLDNDLYVGADDGIEADFCAHNCRIMRNRITNSFIALSSQPGLGGPTYFIRNAVYNTILSAFKLQRGSVGDVLLHNTVVKNGDAFGIYTSDVFSRQYSRNNLMIGGPGGTYGGYANGSGRVIALDAASAGDYDYDGFGSTTGTFSGRIGASSFSSLATLQTNTTEKNAVQLSLAAFAGTVAFPTSPFPAKPVADLRLASGGGAVDKGLVIPNINDGFAGDAPDLGAFELGAAEPAYGPR